ncbi:MAG: glycosyltransferase family 4 protein [Candidatus Omnitrophica bacterium]|nr:glycosyltransferase family 4 protein [Candidatus Omnitrophota bacterium]
MNILILTTHLDPGGITRYALNLSEELSRDHRVWVASSGGSWQDRFSRSGVGFKWIPIKTKSILDPKIIACFFNLLPFLVKNKIDVICANTRVTQFLAYLMYRAGGIPYVSVYHGFYKARYERKVLKFQGARTIAVSESVKRHLTEDLGVPSEQIRVVYNGIDPARFAPRSKKQDSRGRIRLGILGRISAEKGHLLVVETVKELIADGVNVSLYIAGEGKLKKKVTEYVTRCGLDAYVEFVSADGERFLDMIDILIVASSKEGFGYIILEAFAKEVPVVAYAVGGIKEIVSDGQNGLLFWQYNAGSLKEKLVEIINDYELQQQLVINGKGSLSRFSLEQMARETARVLGETLR